MAENPKIKSYKEDTGLLILRFVFGGILIIQHGWADAQLLFRGNHIEVFQNYSIMGKLTLSFMVLSKLICAFLVLIGLFTRFASIPIIIVMLLSLTILNSSVFSHSMETDFLYLGAFLSILYLGAGAFSLDQKIAKV